MSVTTDVFAYALSYISHIKGFSQANFWKALEKLKEYENGRAGQPEQFSIDLENDEEIITELIKIVSEEGVPPPSI